MPIIIYVYAFALVFGLILLGASVFLGGDDADVDADADADFDADGDADAGGHADGGHGDIGGLFGVLGSTRFWTFFAAFFGMTGLVLDGLDLAAPVIAGGLAVGVGSLCGWAAVTVLRHLGSSDSGVVAGVNDYVGKTGEVRLAAGPGRLGKVRIELRGTTVDVLAVSEDADLARGEQALIVGMDGTKALVVKYDGSSQPIARA